MTGGVGFAEAGGHDFEHCVFAGRGFGYVKCGQLDQVVGVDIGLPADEDQVTAGEAVTVVEREADREVVGRVVFFSREHGLVLSEVGGRA